MPQEGGVTADVVVVLEGVAELAEATARMSRALTGAWSGDSQTPMALFA